MSLASVLVSSLTKSPVDWLNLTEVDIAYLSELSEKSWRNRFHVMIYTYVLILLGTIGNVVILITFARGLEINATRVFVLTMSIYDLLSAMVGLPLSTVKLQYAYNSFNVWFCRSVYVLTTLPTQSSSLMIVLIAVDRYRRLVRPLQTQLSVSNAWKLVICCSGISFLCFGIFTPIFGHYTRPSNVTGVPLVMCGIDTDYRSSVYVEIYKFLLAVTALFCLSTILIAYGLACYRFWKRREKTALFTRQPPKPVAVIPPESAQVTVEDVTASFMFNFEEKMRRSSIVSREPSETSMVSIVSCVDETVSRQPEVIATVEPPKKCACCRKFFDRSLRRIPSEDTIVSSISDDTTPRRTTGVCASCCKRKCCRKCRCCRRRKHRVNLTKTGLTMLSTINHQALPNTNPEQVPQNPILPLADSDDQFNKPMDYPGQQFPRTSVFLPAVNVGSGVDITAQSLVTQVGQPPLPFVEENRMRYHAKRLLSVISLGGRSDEDRENVCRQRVATQVLDRIRGKTTKMMIILAFCYMLNWIPPLVCRLFSDDPLYVCPNFTECGGNIYDLAMRTPFLNCVLNVLLYSFSTGRFRKECFRRLGCTRLCKRCRKR